MRDLTITPWMNWFQNLVREYVFISWTDGWMKDIIHEKMYLYNDRKCFFCRWNYQLIMLHGNCLDHQIFFYVFGESDKISLAPASQLKSTTVNEASLGSGYVCVDSVISMYSYTNHQGQNYYLFIFSFNVELCKSLFWLCGRFTICSSRIKSLN